MGTVPVVSSDGIESGLVDAGMIPLAALDQWHSPIVREAMADIARQAHHSRVYDQSVTGHNKAC
ncbi:hypothetical protein ACFQ1S_11675 [Kibdelosporangium lantanae]|uniref:Uncharacterized protein n=1 Tax=Kibdelosporangium lantanae TaxID=1497396 RepID=A0ABW3MA76_9PSEU